MPGRAVLLGVSPQAPVPDALQGEVGELVRGKAPDPRSAAAGVGSCVQPAWELLTSRWALQPGCRRSVFTGQMRALERLLRASPDLQLLKCMNVEATGTRRGGGAAVPFASVGEFSEWPDLPGCTVLRTQPLGQMSSVCQGSSV